MLRKLLKKMLNFGFVENYHIRKMIIYPPAKINIGLYVTDKRSDGFHNIESLFFPLGLHDILEYIPAKKDDLYADELSQTGIPIPGETSDNLVMKALNELRKISILPYFRIHLHKRIPLGAGLGGGSSDAAFLIKELSKMCRPSPSVSQLKEIALKVGSDCPFFLNPVSSLAKGRGELLKEFNTRLDGFWISVFNPGIHVSTAEAYSKVKIGYPEYPLEEALNNPLEGWKEKIENVFEDFVFQKYPEVGLLKEELYRHGSIYSSMTGSGSSVFTISRDKINWPEDLMRFHIWSGQA